MALYIKAFSLVVKTASKPLSKRLKIAISDSPSLRAWAIDAARAASQSLEDAVREVSRAQDALRSENDAEGAVKALDLAKRAVIRQASTSNDAVADALAAALASTPTPAAPAANPGPPMTGAEQDAFRVAVQQCWNVDVGSEAARVTLTVAFDLDPQGRVQGDVRRISGQGGSDGAIEAAFQAARRAILRCQRDGYVLPADKYEQWKEVEMTFDPSGMRMR